MGDEEEEGSSKYKALSFRRDQFYLDLGTRKPRYDYVPTDQRTIGAGTFGDVWKCWRKTRVNSDPEDQDQDRTGTYCVVKRVNYGRFITRTADLNFSPQGNGIAKVQPQKRVTREILFLSMLRESKSAYSVEMTDYFLTLQEGTPEEGKGDRPRRYEWNLFLNIVMPYHAFSLLDLIKEDDWQSSFAATFPFQVYRQLILGIGELRELGIIHRDIKPGNVLLDLNFPSSKGDLYPHLKIADFGSATSVTNRPKNLEVCTITYRAPELLLGNRFYAKTCDSDLWSLGVVGSELFLSSGAKLFPYLLNDPKMAEFGLEAVAALSGIFLVMGTPSKEHLNLLNPKANQDVVDFLSRAKLPRLCETIVLGLPEEQPLKSSVFPLLRWDIRERSKFFEILHSQARHGEESFYGFARKRVDSVENMVLEG